MNDRLRPNAIEPVVDGMQPVNVIARLGGVLLSLALVVSSGCGGQEDEAPAFQPSACEPSGDLQNAPPDFPHADGQVVFVDICSVSATLELEPGADTARVSATVVFHQPAAGYPMIDLVPSIDRLVVDGQELAASDFVTIPTPDDETEVSIVETVLRGGAHEIEVTYALPIEAQMPLVFGKTLGDEFIHGEQEVDYFLYLNDVEPRHYLEKHFPSNYPYDAYGFDLRVTIATDADHRLFTNGELTSPEPNVFDVSFPDWFNATAPFLHVAPSSVYTVVEDQYAGLDGDIDLVVYGSHEREGVTAQEWREGIASTAMNRVKLTLESMEDDFGAYALSSFLVRLEPGRTGPGMEHAGATITHLFSLAHEIAHSWFARGVLPANGNAEWIDEAICTWYLSLDSPTVESLAPPSGGKLSGFSPYRRELPLDEAFTAGPDVMAMLDDHFAETGGMVPILAELYDDYAKQRLTTEAFLAFLNARSDEPLDDFFAENVYPEE